MTGERIITVPNFSARAGFVGFMGSCWLVESFAHRPFHDEDAMVNQTSRQACFRAPLRKGLGAAVMGQIAVVTRVVLLLLTGGPYAVGRLVVTVVIQAVNRMIVTRARPHIGIKVFKGLPPFANLNASASIQRIFLCIRILTSRFHAKPYGVERRIAHAVGSVRISAMAKTIAAFNRSSSQMVSACRGRLSTPTLTKPVRFSFSEAKETQDSQPVESASGQVFEARVRRNGLKRGARIVDGHFANSPKNWISDLARLGMVLVAPLRAVSILPL